MLDLNKLTYPLLASKAIAMIVGFIGMFASAFVAIALFCRIIVLMLQVITSSVEEMIRLYNLQVPIIQLAMLLMLICGALYLLSHVARFVRLQLEFMQARRLSELMYAEMIFRTIGGSYATR
jgi:hypothetical protein